MTVFEITINTLRDEKIAQASSKGKTAAGRYQYPRTLREAFRKAKNYREWQ